MKYRIIADGRYRVVFTIQMRNSGFLKLLGWVDFKVCNSLEEAREVIQEIIEGKRDKYGDKIIGNKIIKVIEEYEI